MDIFDNGLAAWAAIAGRVQAFKLINDDTVPTPTTQVQAPSNAGGGFFTPTNVLMVSLALVAVALFISASRK